MPNRIEQLEKPTNRIDALGKPLVPAGPELSLEVWNPSVWERAKRYFYTPPPAGGWDRSDKPLRTAGKLGAVGVVEGVSGAMLGLPNIATSKLTDQATAGEALASALGLQRTPSEMAQGRAVQQFGTISTMGAGTARLVGKIGASRALTTMLHSGLTFGSAEAVDQAVQNITTNKPFDIEGIHFNAGVGVVFGAGVAGVQKFTDFVKAMRSTKALTKLHPGMPGQTPAQHAKAARAAAIREIRTVKSKYGVDSPQWEAVVDKYVRAGRAVSPPRPVKNPYPRETQNMLARYNTAIQKAQSRGDWSAVKALRAGEQIELGHLEKRIDADNARMIRQLAGEDKVKSLKKAPAKPAPTKPVGGRRQGGFLTLPDTPSPEAMRAGAESIYQDTINRFAAIENVTKKAQKLGMKILPGENPALRARSYLGLGRKVESVLNDKTYRITPEGQIEHTGEGLKPILDDYDRIGKTFEKKRSQRKKDWNTYLDAQRTIHDLQRPKNEWTKDHIVTPEQVAKAKEDLDWLKSKYGTKGMANLSAQAKRLYEYQKRVLHGLVDSGNLSQKQYDDIISKNKHYVPFDRILDEDIGGGVPVSKNRFTKARAPVKKIKGSDRAKQDFTESIIKNTYRIMEAADRNAVARSVAQLGEIIPQDINPVRIKMMPIKVDPKEILTVSKTFASRSSEVMKEVRDTQKSGGPGADVSGPMKKLEKVVKDALVHRGFSEGESNSFIAQIRKGEGAESPESVIETIEKTIKETQRIITTEEPIESTIWRPSQFAPKGNVIEYFDNGKRKYIEVSPNLYKAMTGLNEGGANLLFKMLGKPAHWLRVGATSTPEFMARNYIRDQYTAGMNTNFGFTPFIDPALAIADILGKSQAYYDWMRSGGAYSGFVELNRPSLKKAAKELTAPRSRKLIGKLNIISNLQDLSQLIEQSTRVAMFKKARAAGMSDIEAGFQSREGTVDFQRRGGSPAVKGMNEMTAFLNAGFQGAERSFRQAGTHAAATLLKGVAGITIPSIVLHYLNRHKEGFDEIPRWQKDLFWVHKVGDTWYRIPKPFLYGQVFGSLPERFLEYIETKDPQAFEELGKTMFESVVPVSGEPEGWVLPTALKPIIENWGNTNFFLERSIVPRSKEDLLPPYQHGRYTTETAKILGEKLNYSPAKIENLVRGWTGGMGRYALEGSDYLVNSIRAARAEPVPPKQPKTAADIPLVKGFVVRDPLGPTAKSIQQFYDKSDDVIKTWNTYRHLFKDTDLSPEDVQKSKDFIKKYPKLVLGAKGTERGDTVVGELQKARQLMSLLDKQADNIIKMDISQAEKKRMLKKIDQARLNLARESNKKIK